MTDLWTRAPRAIRNAYRWLFLTTLIYAPWAYGCTTAETIVILDYLLGAVMTLWIADLLIRRTVPTIPRALVALVMALLVTGWGMALNARAVYDPAFQLFAPTASRVAALPGSYDQANSIAWMIRGTLLLLSSCFVADLVQRPRWLLRLWQTIAVAGGSIGLLGLIQKGSGARMIFWEDSVSPVTTFFATYYYHANAGAYLNLVFPLTIGLAVRSLVTPHSPVVRTTWLTAAIAVTLAIVSNTSKAAQAIGLGLMVALIALMTPKVRHVVAKAEKTTIAVALVVAAIAIYAIAQASRLDQPLKRWQQLGTQLETDDRWGAAVAALPAANEAGWFGFGPGSFRSVFPNFVDRTGGKLEGGWRFLHQDYLQTVMEWGWIGSGLWALLFFGGMGMAFTTLRRQKSFQRGAESGTRGRMRSPEQEAGAWMPRQRTIIPLVLLALGSVALHALVDFPLQIASIQLYVATYLGICWGSKCWK